MTGTSVSPTFVLSGPGSTLIAEGTHTRYPEVAAAQAALRRQTTPIIVGALAFDVSAPAALVRPATHGFGGALPGAAHPRLPPVRVAAAVPAPGDHQARIRRALAVLGDPASELRKVVLARALDLAADDALDIPTLLSRLSATDPAAYTYAVDLSAAGGGYTGAALVGASPELLVARSGDRVTCQPFAGSAPRGTDPDTDRAQAAALAASAKNRTEHALVVDAMRKALDPLCVDLQIPAAPQLSSTAALWHLSTPIAGRLRDGSTTALDLALALHPTPAVGGVPTEDALAMIAELEGDRGFYAGAAGWCDRHGDGRWVVAIRCAQLSADRRTARAYAGGGIVADSDASDELAETTTKFKTILGALGVGP